MFDLKDFEFYSFSVTGKRNYGFIFNNNDIENLEGEIHLGYGNYGGREIDTLAYVDYIEIVSEHELDDEFMENLELFLEENITYIFDNAKHIA
jgi:hypothetical protein